MIERYYERIHEIWEKREGVFYKVVRRTKKVMSWKYRLRKYNYPETEMRRLSSRRTNSNNSQQRSKQARQACKHARMQLSKEYLD